MGTFLLTGWWAGLSGIEQVFWGISIVFSVLFVIQFVLSLIGLDFDADAEADFDHAGSVDGLDADFTIFSVRGIIAFFTFFGWTGVVALSNGLGTVVSLLLAIGSGFAAMFIVAYLFYLFLKLQSSGTLNLDNALDGLGEVYLIIPGENSGTGKIQIKVQGSLRELDAITEGEEIPTGSTIRVIDVLENGLLLVEPIENKLLLD